MIPSFFPSLCLPAVVTCFSRQTHPGWKRRGPAPLCPAAPQRCPAGAGGTDALSPGPGGHRVAGAPVRRFSQNGGFISLSHLPACSGQRAPDQRTPSSRWLCLPAPAPAPAPACGRKPPYRSPVESGTRCPGCCKPAPPHADSLKSTHGSISRIETCSLNLIMIQKIIIYDLI